MQEGKVVSIQTAPAAGAPMVSLDKVRAVVGRGLEGDRYFNQIGTYSVNAGPHREVTFIELEAVEAIQRDSGIQVEAGAIRRNIVTQGVALNHLVDRQFQVGEVTLRGVRLSVPCEHMEQLTQRPGIMKSLVHRSGLNAEVLTEGIIHVDDSIQVS